MARKPRAEIEGGLYHVITRGNNRRRIFDSAADYEKFLSLLAKQKSKLPFLLYAYCLMTNHVHLLIERQADSVGRIMHRLLTGYAQYYNRRYRRVGHLFEGRHKSILCQSERYLAELVRYIHLNPVRAGMVKRAEEYQYSGHRAYLGLEPAGIVDVDPVLRHFGGQRKLARRAYFDFVNAGMKLGHQSGFYLAEDGRILGTEEFVDATIHRIGESEAPGGKRNRSRGIKDFQPAVLLEVLEIMCGIKREEFCSGVKSRATIAAKEVCVLTGFELGASLKALSEMTGLSRSAVSRRLDRAKLRVREDEETSKLAVSIMKAYGRRVRIAKSQA
jgi:REP element-mobilizing transposase RayT